MSKIEPNDLVVVLHNTFDLQVITRLEGRASGKRYNSFGLNRDSERLPQLATVRMRASRSHGRVCSRCMGVLHGRPAGLHYCILCQGHHDQEIRVLVYHGSFI